MPLHPSAPGMYTVSTRTARPAPTWAHSSFQRATSSARAAARARSASSSPSRCAVAAWAAASAAAAASASRCLADKRRCSRARSPGSSSSLGRAEQLRPEADRAACSCLLLHDAPATDPAGEAWLCCALCWAASACACSCCSVASRRACGWGQGGVQVEEGRQMVTDSAAVQPSTHLPATGILHATACSQAGTHLQLCAAACQIRVVLLHLLQLVGSGVCGRRRWVLRRVLLHVVRRGLAQRRGAMRAVAAVPRAAATGGRVQGEGGLGEEDGWRACGAGGGERGRRCGAGRGQAFPVRRAVLPVLLHVGRHAELAPRRGGREVERGGGHLCAGRGVHRPERGLPSDRGMVQPCLCRVRCTRGCWQSLSGSCSCCARAQHGAPVKRAARLHAQLQRTQGK